MKNKITFLLVMLLSSANSYTQNATVTFSSAQDCRITIYEPIDGAYNNELPTKELKVTANVPCIYTTGITSHGVMMYQFSQGTKCDVILFPDDSIKIHIDNKQIRFEGSNQEGLQFLYDKFVVTSHYSL